MNKSRQFDNILDECLGWLLRGETVEQCLRRFPEYADELHPLLETVMAVKETSAIQPGAEFRERARYQFHSALREMETGKRRFFFNWRPVWVTALATVLVVVLAGGGTVMAATGSMPDETLYPVKLATEQVRLALTPSALGKAEVYAELADRRVNEIARMADEDKPEEIEETARRLDIYLAKIADLASPPQVAAVAPKALLAPQAAPAPEPARVEEEDDDEEEEEMHEAAAPAEEAAKLAAAPAAEEAPLLSEREGAGGEERGESDRHRDKLKVTVTNNAASHLARLHALLEKAPESAKPALRRAIALSEDGYEKALKSLED